VFRVEFSGFRLTDRQCGQAPNTLNEVRKTPASVKLTRDKKKVSPGFGLDVEKAFDANAATLGKHQEG
jgi:hypothetical protein